MTTADSATCLSPTCKAGKITTAGVYACTQGNSSGGGVQPMDVGALQFQCGKGGKYGKSALMGTDGG
eukprot:5367946-Amphidinium_carterae.2